MISSPGIGSGLDVNSIVSQLMDIERLPLTSLDAKEAKQQAQLTAFGSLKGALSTFQDSISSLANPAKFSAVSANMTDETVATASATSKATAGSYSIEVQALAQAQKIKSSNFTDSAVTIGSGTLTIQFGTYSDGNFNLNSDKAAQTITIANGESSLTGIRNAINNADAGVTASIVNDGSGDRLVIAAKDTGLSNALKITAVDDDANHTDNAGLSQLAFDASTGGTANLTETVAASNATLIIDGITISKASNVVSDAIEGVTLDLLKTNTDSTTTLSIAHDTAGVEESIQSFVNAFNDLGATITGLSNFNTTTNQASILTGDSTVRSVQSKLRSVLNAPLTTAGGGFSTLSDIGITFNKNGALQLDTAKLSSSMADTTKDISTLFSSIGKPSDSLVSFVSASTNTQDGQYDLDISQLATRGTAVGNTTAALVVNTGINDALDLTINGVSASIILAAGTYTATSMAAEIQSKINGASELSKANIFVAVSESAGVLSITTDDYGSNSIVSITGGTGKTGLFGTPIETAGVDVAGTIGGVAASGTGQILVGSGSNSGLILEITGGATGPRGTVNFAHGFAFKLGDLVESMLKNNNLIDGRIDGINAAIKDIGTQRVSISLRLEGVEQRMRAQFTSLDIMISSMTQTSDFLKQQLENLPTIGSQ